MVEESAVFVVGDDQRGAVPVGALYDGVVGLEDEFLPREDVGRWVIVVRTGGADEADIDEVGVDPGNRWQLAVARVVEEVARGGDTFSVEIGEVGEVPEGVV